MKSTRSLGLLLGAVALLTFGAPTAVLATDHKPAVCEDHAPHKARMVKVAPGVELEVLDWGGKGRAMVLLTGLGDNAHVYDNFAFQFTDHFHVYGITRRGFLPSSQPRTGYDVPTRAKDDIAVLDALGVAKAVFVGHSLAGSERLTRKELSDFSHLWLVGVASNDGATRCLGLKSPVASIGATVCGMQAT